MQQLVDPAEDLAARHEVGLVHDAEGFVRVVHVRVTNNYRSRLTFEFKL